MRIPRWIVGFVLLWICAITAVSGVGWRHQENTNQELERQNDQILAETAQRLEASCSAGNESRAQIRRMSRDAPIEVGEALIEVAGADNEPPDPAVVDAFRTAMQRRLDGIVNQLPAREWDPDTRECVDVPLDTGG